MKKGRGTTMKVKPTYEDTMTDKNTQGLEIVKAFASREAATANEVMALYNAMMGTEGTISAPQSAKETSAPKASAPADPAASAKTSTKKAAAAPAAPETSGKADDAPAAPVETAKEKPEPTNVMAGTKPAVPVAKSITNDQIHCLVCGEGMRMLKRHLRAAHDMTPDQYRVAFDLPSDYPMTAPSFSAAKAETAKRLEFGKYDRENANAEG